MNVLETRGLSRKFGHKEAVKALDLTVEAGGIYALLGPNGAGKTTALKTVMNILAPTSGEARVLGVDSRMLGPRQFAQIGYVSENQDLPDWMTVAQLLDFCRPFYPTWDGDFAEKLLRRFALSPQQKLGGLSRGMRMKAALLSSLAYRPRLLVLDEPFSGLDPLARDEFIRGILELTDQEQWTVLLSSHDIDEVEKLADQVGVLNEGRLFLSEPIEKLQGRFRQVTARVPGTAPLPSNLPRTWLGVEKEGEVVQFTESAYEEGGFDRVLQGLWPSATATVRPLSLREIFVVLAKTFRMPNTGGEK